MSNYGQTNDKLKLLYFPTQMRFPIGQDIREIKHHVLRQTATCSRLSLLFLKYVGKMENNSHVHDKRETTHGKQRTTKAGCLPIAGKTNVTLNLSINFISIRYPG